MNKIINFVREAWAELKQVTWLTFPQMVASTWLVIILVAIISGYIFGVDQILRRIIGLFI